MADRVDAAIAALKVALNEAEKSKDWHWKSGRANRWINQLPGAWWGRWRHLKLRGHIFDGEMDRKLFVSDLRAVLAYLNTHKDEIKTARAWPWSNSGNVLSRAMEPLDVDFNEIKSSKEKTSQRKKDSVRLIKG
ncbi:MAG TPA: hypothetical protein VKA94_13370 [Hyphomicrobiales bacterium]|nr:hypothetical protein [Hyphomicrobiales bacterium]